MTRDEVKIILKAIVSSYPNYKPSNLSDTVDVWTAMLTDYDYPTISKALQKYILSDTSGFAPSIGQIIGNIETSVEREPLEAWALVRKAISNSVYNAEEEFSKLPPECQTAIGNANNLKEMSQMDSATVESVEQSHFIRSYQSVIKRMSEEKRLPQQYRSYTQQIAEKMKQPKAIEVKEITEEKVIVEDRIPLAELIEQKRRERKEREKKKDEELRKYSF